MSVVDAQHSYIRHKDRPRIFGESHNISPHPQARRASNPRVWVVFDQGHLGQCAGPTRGRRMPSYMQGNMTAHGCVSGRLHFILLSPDYTKSLMEGGHYHRYRNILDSEGSVQGEKFC